VAVSSASELNVAVWPLFRPGFVGLALAVSAAVSAAQGDDAAGVVNGSIAFVAGPASDCSRSGRMVTCSGG
jgi:hypothetical protein